MGINQIKFSPHFLKWKNRLEADLTFKTNQTGAQSCVCVCVASGVIDLALHCVV